MKRKIEFYQKYITKLKALVEEDRGVADLFTNLRAEDTDMDDLQDVADDGYRVEDIESRQINIEASNRGMEWVYLAVKHWVIMWKINRKWTLITYKLTC